MPRVMRLAPTEVVFDELRLPLRRVTTELESGTHKVIAELDNVKVGKPYPIKGLRVMTVGLTKTEGTPRDYCNYVLTNDDILSSLHRSSHFYPVRVGGVRKWLCYIATMGSDGRVHVSSKIKNY